MRPPIPSDERCYEILRDHQVPKDIVDHILVVTSIVDDYTDRLCRAGYLLDKKLIHAAALLHDVGKGHEPHAQVGAQWVEEAGYPQVARLIAEHTTLSEDAFENIDGRAILYMCDKMELGGKCVPLSERFAVSFKRYENDEARLSDMKEQYARASQLYTRIQKLISAAPAAAGAKK